MPDRFGPKGVLAIMIPQQNSNMQPEYERLRPDGISNQIYRFDISGQDRVAEACLLYTSPSPRDATLSRMPSSA